MAAIAPAWVCALVIRLSSGWDSMRTAPVCAFDSEGQGHMSQAGGKFVWRAVEKDAQRQ